MLGHVPIIHPPLQAGKAWSKKGLELYGKCKNDREPLMGLFYVRRSMSHLWDDIALEKTWGTIRVNFNPTKNLPI